MKIFLQDALTLVELLIAVALIGILTVAISSLATYANFNLLHSDRSKQMQDEAYFVLEHMAGRLGQAIGSVGSPGVIISGTDRIKVRLDRNGNGQPDDDGVDDWVAYEYDSGQNRVHFYPQYPGGAVWPVRDSEILTSMASNFSIGYVATENYASVDISTCTDPSSLDCGSRDTPEISMKVRIKFPAVSVN
ncbi:PilW family protein [Candidatus Omnitrophota bacterium]